MEGDDISQTDKRITWMIQRVAAAHKPWVKPKDLERLEEDEPCIVFKDFLDHKETSALFVVYTGQVLQLLLEPPADFKARKVLYFVKREAKQVKPENISRLVQFGELHPNPLESLLYTESHINPALLKVEENVAQVAEVARPQLNDKMDGFRSGLLVTQGLAEGKSRLPLPTLVDLSQRDRDKEIVYQLESVVVGWISQMRHAIAASPSTLFESSHPDTRGTPSALHEIKFWRQKCDDLRGLEVQLSSPAVLKLLSILKNADSSYYRPFVQLQEELHQSSLEASSNLRFLEPLCDGQDSPFMLLAGHPAVSFDELVEAKVFEKILHHIFLLWEYSKYYNTVPRLVVLFREICNDIIESARLFINSSELFQLDAEDASHRLSICLATCTHFKSIYFKVKQRTNSASRRGPWKLHNSIFLRLDRFLERCDDLLDVLETATLFGRLDPEMGRVIVGGTHGAEACSVIGTVYTDFVSLHRDFYDCGIDLLDVEDTRFDDIYTDFRQKTKQLEQKLGTLFVTSLQDSHTLANLFKVVDSFDGFLGRALIHQEWQQRQMDVIRTYHEDLLATQECFTATVSRDRRLEDPRGFQRQLVATAGANGSMFPQKPGAAFDKQGADIYDRMPPTTARVIWARSLLSRIEQPLLKMNELISPAVQQSEQWKTTAALVAVLQGTINQYIQSQLGTWVGGIDGAQKKLELSLLEKRDDGAVQVNFDKELSKLLREVTYIEGIEECDGKAKDASKVPTSTQSTLADPAGLRSQVYKLEAVCRQYNEMRATVLPMEQAIFAEEFAHCEDLLASGMRNLTWHDASVGRWVASVSATVGDLSAAIGGLRDAVAAVEKALRQFTAEDTFLPLDPKEAKTMPCDEFSRRFAEYNAGRRGKAAAKSTEARRVCAAAFAAVNDFKARRSSPIAPLDENDPPWRAFVSHVNSCCEALVVACVEHALANLRNQLSGEWLSEQSGIPLLDIKLTIDTKANPVRGDFAPPLTQANTRHTGVTLESLVETWIDDCKQYAGVFQTLDDTGRTFSSAVAGHTRCEELAREILLQVGASIDECRAFQRQFDGFAYLWETQLDSVFQKFIDDHTPDLAEASESQLQLQQPPPEDAEITVESFERTFFSGASLDDYSAEISRYNRVQDAIGSLPDGQQCSWLRIDAKPMKIALRDCCAKWRSVFVNHLVDKTRSELDSLYSFVKTAESELEIQVTSLDDLKSVMKWVRECKQLNPKVEIMFEPMGQVIAMLKRQACISDDLVAELENLRRDGPETWLALHKKSLNIREEYSKMQDQEADRVEEEAQEFLEVLSSFAAMFDNTGAFSYLDDTDAAYTEMDHIHLELLGRETESSRFNSEQALFDLEKTDFRLLKECRQKLRLLKGIWDLIAHVRATFAFWYETPFMAVDVEELSDEVTKLLKQLKSQPTKTKSWPCFEGLQADVKRMSMSLPLIQDLREEAVRDRHWVQLLRETDHANLSIDPRSTSCTLLDLLSLSLHEHQDIVQNTVEKATKELQLETNLNRVATTWNAQKFTYEYDDNLAAWTLGKVDDISDELDSDTNLLQQMQSNRFVAYFQEPVAKWMDNLGKIESTLLIWLDAQKRWTNLYPIFVKSQDIRVSLPDDAKVFESADELYREMMDKIRHHENVVSVCCSDLLKKVLERDDDIEEVLGIVLDVLRQCEKALADYLESKKRLFPRFFFLADADLVDILSKGSQPKEIMTHMSKIVDAVDTFNFLPDRPSTVHGIVSIQGEKVPLAYEYTCQGAVEDWLSGCIDVVRASIKAKIDEANSSYMEQPRISWIFNCCCQAVIVASRLQFTWETNSAFAQLEDGNELAMKDHMQLQQKQLSEEIRLVLGELSTNDRSMLVHLITIDVHNRDIIQWLIDEKAENDTHFTWQSQLRYLWHEAKGVVIKICDSEFAHGYEYVGLCGCLVVTKLTDRCYITLTQALKLMQGGAPAGPAGTGKTETTKDLARNLGIACYVFNCSDQMNYQGLGRIFKGLAMSGCWGCFDEFNRISIEVLSVVATQISSILYGLRMRKQIFKFANEEDISLVPTCGAFVTMNPGYAGRTELPENIKSLFRPCAMVVPDIQNICEILLAAEGFVEAKSLALKFVQLYKLNKELLSQQLHYDWGLRAVKSVLVIAGTLRRDEQTLDEKLILLRALRDTNLAKLSKDDVYVFRGLIKALFPSMAVARKVDEELKGRLRVACAKLQLFAGENDTFVEKCLQFDELLRVRHSVFVLGPAGCGKTECRNALRAAFLQEAGGCKVRAMNPKAITANEMYGTTHEQTKEWREGHLAHIFKEFSVLSKTNTCRKWIVLDGIIDAEWIESMNTVMDDNKMLTLANNDRIPLTPSMRMVFEISQLQNASPATVSRAGILYINDVDVGWNPFVDRWLLSREDEREHNYLDSFFDSYLPSVFEQLKKGIATVVQIADISLVQTLCALLDALLHNVPHGSPQEVYEKYFCFALVWAFGGALASDGRVDYRAAFSKWWVREMQSRVRICDEKYQVFDFYISKETHHEFCSWNELVAKYKTDPDLPMSEQLVETAETVRMQQMLQLLMTQQHPVLLVGMAGTGKSKIVLSKLAGLDSTNWMTRHTSFNAKTTARTFQLVLEANLERSGRKWHPPGRKKLVFFMDDLNMPLPDKYGTQEPIALLRQYLDYGFWFDRGSPGVEKHVAGIQLVASMNHKAGSFTILDRALRWFSVFALSMPGGEDLTTIYQSLLAAHVRSWSSHVRNLVPILVNATVELLQAMREQFLPTAAKFHYHWNLREVSNVFQGLTSTMRALHDGDAILFIRLWKHECERVFRDRMVDEHETAEYDSLCAQVVTKYFSDVVVVDDVLREPNLWAPFGQHGDEIDIYDQIDSFEQLSVFLEGKLDEYNEDTTRARMDLVLFNQAMEHVTRICRILSRPNGNALLIGVGGSGKQSLSRLSAFINEMDAYQIMVTQTYNGSDFRRNVSELYIKCGRKNQRFAFVITDAQIVCSQQLVVLNDMLNSGNVPNLFEPEVADEITHAMLPELRQRQHPDYHNKEVCWKYFISKVQANLHTVLCFSPVGQQLATWCRHFPALATTTVIDWFHSWAPEALFSVSRRFLSAPDFALSGESSLVDACASSISETHLFVTSLADEYKAKNRRYCYTTPKSFMELISTYKNMLRDKRLQQAEKTRRLVDGIHKIKLAKDSVHELQVKLKDEDTEVRMASQEVATLMEQVSTDKAAIQEEAERAEVEKKKTEKLVTETDALKAEAERDLAAAQPLVERAKAALKSLNKASLTELKSFTKPPQEVLMVTAAVMCLTAHPNRIPRPEIAKDWSNAKKMMSNISQWLKELEDFGANMSNDIPQPCIDAIQVWVRDPNFDAECMKSKSEAASCLSAWVSNMDAYHTLRCQVRPKEEKLQEARERLEVSKSQFQAVQDHVTNLNNKLNALVEAHNTASEKSRILKEKVESTRLKMNIAERLVSGLADENIRWSRTVEELREGMHQLVGDVLVAAAFISYAGPFSSEYRERLIDHLNKDVQMRRIPHMEGQDVVTGILTSEAEVAAWNNEGLPTDRISTENGAIVKTAKRWPLLIDPQLQGITWIKAKEASHGLVVTQQGNTRYLDDVIHCLQMGLPCLIQNLPETIDPILDPILSKEFARKGTSYTCKVGDKDVDVNISTFRLYLQTKHPNPHYKPELNAQTTLVNFMVTESGLEDQLLAVVVNMERPELEERRAALIRQMNQYKIDLSSCEDKLLIELSNAEGDLLENVVLITNLEDTKKQAGMIAKALIDDRVTQEELMEQRLVYKPAATRGSLIFFEIDRLAKINSIYQYSLEAFMSVYSKALQKADSPEPDSDEEDEEKRRHTTGRQRLQSLMRSITETTYAYVSRGLFERHKIIFSSLLCFSILSHDGEIDKRQLEFLLVGGRTFSAEPPPPAIADWCSTASWGAVKSLAELSGPVSSSSANLPTFDQFPDDLQQHNRWRNWAEHFTPEEEKLPTDWRNVDSFHRLLFLRCLRPDRLIAALNNFVSDRLGKFFVTDSAVPLSVSFADSSPTAPIFFILSPGVDPVRRIEQLGAELGISYDRGNFFNVSLGQGQEKRAIQALDHCFTRGGWVVLSNIHLAKSWLSELEKKLDHFSDLLTKSQKQQQQSVIEVKDSLENEHTDVTEDTATRPDYRIFLSAESQEETTIPIGILQRCIKLTNEPPSGIKANMLRALAEFKDEPWENSCKPTDFKSVLFVMCWFHSVIVERKKFGKLGWNKEYPFNVGDLTSCVDVLNNYMEERPNIPWEDLRYVFGEILYGGHITDDWDRRLCSAYLEEFIRPEVTEHMELCPNFAVPQYNSHQEAILFVQENMPPESPHFYGLHTHAELGFHITQAEYLFSVVNELQTGSSSSGAPDADTLVQAAVDEILNCTIQDAPHNLEDIAERLEDDKTPQQHVFYQECERMNILQNLMKTTLKELVLGMQGALSISEPMIEIHGSIRLDRVPERWSRASFVTRRGLASWCQNITARNSQLIDWTMDLVTPKVTRLDYLFNPMSFITSICQYSAMLNNYELDQMDIVCEPSKRMIDGIEHVARDGAHIFGLKMEGGRWDITNSTIDDCKSKELFSIMPVLTIRALPCSKVDRRDQYECPLYKTQQRGTGFVTPMYLRTRQPAIKWIIAGVACILDVVEV